MDNLIILNGFGHRHIIDEMFWYWKIICVRNWNKGKNYLTIIPIKMLKINAFIVHAKTINTRFVYDYVIISAQMRVGLGVTFGMRWIWSSSSWWDFWAGCSGLCSTQSTYSWPNTEWNMCRRNIKLSGMKTSKFYNEMPLIIYTRNVQLYV